MRVRPKSFRRGNSRLVLCLAAAVAVPCCRLAAQTNQTVQAGQTFDSTGMPSLELLAMEAGRASRAHPIRAVAPRLLCEPGHALVDSASLAACAALPPDRAAAITAAFARGLQTPLDESAVADSAVALPACPADLDRTAGPRVLVARLTVPLVGVYEGRWEGRLTVELRCRSPGGAGGGAVSTVGKQYLYQWSGRAWEMYQHSWWRAGD